jgi:hypothetical protein
MSEKRVNIFKLLENEGKLITVWAYPAQETVSDPYEKNKTRSFLNPIPIKALVTDISFEALRWKYYGKIPSGSKQIICEKRHFNLLKIADKIKIDDDYFKTYQDDQKGFAILKREDYLVAIMQIKNE